MSAETLGRGPAHARTHGAEALTPARRVVLDVLGTTDGAATVAEVSAATGLHLNTVREHLEALVDQGLAARGRLEPQGRGRPASTYEYAPLADVLSPGHGLMTNAVIDYVAATFGAGEEVARHAYDAGRQWGREIVERGLGGTKEGVGALDAVVSLLDDAGFDPRVTTGSVPGSAAQTPEVRLLRCPVLTLARTHPELVCQAHQGMVDECLTLGAGPLAGTAGAAGEDVATRLEAFVQPGYCRINIGVAPQDAGLVVGDMAGTAAPAGPGTPRRAPDTPGAANLKD